MKKLALLTILFGLYIPSSAGQSGNVETSRLGYPMTEIISEIQEEGGKIIFSLSSDSVMYAEEKDAEYTWPASYSEAAVSLFLYRKGSSLYIKLADLSPEGPLSRKISTFAISDGNVDPENIFNNVYIAREEISQEVFGIASLIEDNSILFLINNVDRKRSTAFKTRLENLLVYQEELE